MTIDNLGMNARQLFIGLLPKVLLSFKTIVWASYSLPIDFTTALNYVGLTKTQHSNANMSN
jgi:hypothetical protein